MLACAYLPFLSLDFSPDSIAPALLAKGQAGRQAGRQIGRSVGRSQLLYLAARLGLSHERRAGSELRAN